ncbi:MAG: general secretion pathway protein GspK [Bryobacteraceae bacterium]
MSISRRGSALLTVLWLTAALSAVAYSLATTVRGETDRASAALDGARAGYLARGAIDRAILYMQWGVQFPAPENPAQYFAAGVSGLHFSFPSGEVDVDITPENAKLNINTIRPPDLIALLAHLGAPLDQAQSIAEAVIDWRTPIGQPSPFDAYYLSLGPSFRPRHASLEETEELLLVRGMTPDLYYGTYERDAQGRLHARTGLRDCVSVFPSSGQHDANTAPAAVLLTLGIPPDLVNTIIERRRLEPFRTPPQLAAIGQGAPPEFQRLRIGGLTLFTLRATARLRLDNGALSDLRRSSAALVKFMPPGYDETFQIMRWYDQDYRP